MHTTSDVDIVWQLVKNIRGGGFTMSHPRNLEANWWLRWPEPLSEHGRYYGTHDFYEVNGIVEQMKQEGTVVAFC